MSSLAYGYIPTLFGSSCTTCLRFEVAGEQVGWVPSKVASILSHYSEVFNSPRDGAITLCQNLDSYSRRSEAVDAVLQTVRKEGSLTCLKGWRDEKYEVMPKFCDTPLMCTERSATSLFGVKRYGVHVNGYSRYENGELRMWLARRSITKQTYPGKLDNLVRFCVFDNFTNFTLQVNIFVKCIMVL
uniref:Nudix hydrolase 20, chloroplast n=1 Tax=Osmerus mordax TaxID=8014 RepID=C1BJJ6_OSMMO|nr:Nudix hydrolase 20, chloroplast precursor [Osmerus mordax]